MSHECNKCVILYDCEFLLCTDMLMDIQILIQNEFTEHVSFSIELIH